MKVILLDDVGTLGRRGEVREVSDGYARNFLIPQKHALTATPGNLKNLAQIKSQQEAKASRIKALVCEERRQASEDGKLFGSVTTQDLADFLARQNIQIEKRRILVEEPIKGLGEFVVSIRLHPEVTARLKVVVVRE